MLLILIIFHPLLTLARTAVLGEVGQQFKQQWLTKNSGLFTGNIVKSVFSEAVQKSRSLKGDRKTHSFVIVCVQDSNKCNRFFIMYC